MKHKTGCDQGMVHVSSPSNAFGGFFVWLDLIKSDNWLISGHEKNFPLSSVCVFLFNPICCYLWQKSEDLVENLSLPISSQTFFTSGGTVMTPGWDVCKIIIFADCRNIPHYLEWKYAMMPSSNMKFYKISKTMYSILVLNSSDFFVTKSKFLPLSCLPSLFLPAGNWYATAWQGCY